MKSINELYEKIPRSICAEGCFKCCINMIQFTPGEEKEMGGYDYNGKCPYIINGKCSIYEKRPFVCRIYGTSEMLKCNDCIPERYLTEKETRALVHEYALIKMKEEAEKKGS
jgi:Fe-S-cluster containining protein